MLFYRLGWVETERYLADRAAKGFTVIQAVALAELPGPDADGNFPLEDNDPLRPAAPFWDRLGLVVDHANSLGLFVALLPTWGDRWNRGPGHHEEIFTPANARAYGRWLGARFAQKGVIWVLGGDRPIETELHRLIIRGMAEGLGEGDGGRHLRTFHPRGGCSSADFVHEEAWLDFNMIQSGHCVNSLDTPWFVTRDLARTPVKPTLDGEPCYEDHPIMNPDWTPVAGGSVRYNDWHVRRAAWRAVFAGACGQAYGAHSVWMMWDERRPVINHVRLTWKEALDLPGAFQMRHLKDFILALPSQDREPCPCAVLRQAAPPLQRAAAMRGESADCPWLAVYFPEPAETALAFPSGEGPCPVRARWFDPATGRWGEAFIPPDPQRIVLRLEDFPSPDRDAVLFTTRL